MRIICDTRPKDSSECFIAIMIRDSEERFGFLKCDGNCKECKYIETIEEHEHYKYDDGYDD